MNRRKCPGNAARQFAIERVHQGNPRRGGGHCVAGHRVFQSSEPGRIRRPIGGQKPIATRHGGVVSGNLPRVARFQGPDQPIEEAPPGPGPFLE